MSDCKHNWNLKGVRCPSCVDEIIKSLQSRLDAAEKFGDEQKVAASDLFNAGIELKKELQALRERIKHRDNYLDSRCEGCPDCGNMGCTHPDLLTKARVQIKAIETENKRLSESRMDLFSDYEKLKEQLTDCDDALLKKGIFREETHALHRTVKKLKEQLARIGEALKKSNWMLDATPLDMRTVEDEELCFNENKKALSSYDPKWIEGVRDEAKAEAFIEASEMIVEMKLNGGTIAGTIAPMRVLAKQYRQSNQSREKRV